MGTAVPAPQGIGAVLGAWTWAPLWDVLIVLAALGYLVQVRRQRRRTGVAWPWTRTTAAGCAAGGLVLTFDGPLAVFGPQLFWVHMLQHLVLIMVVPVLVIWSQPVRLVLGNTGTPRVPAPARRAGRVLTSPLLAVPVYAAVLVGTHLTTFQQVMFGQPWVHHVESALYLISGYLLFGALTGSDRWPWRLPYLVRFTVLGLSMAVDAFVGVVLMVTDYAVAPGFAAGHPGWGPGAVADQRAAGAVMWVGGDGLMMVLMIVVAVQWGRAGSGEQALGGWLEGVRRRELLGGLEDDPLGDAAAGVDDDDAALRRYNDMLAGLHEPGRRVESVHRQPTESS